MSSLFQELYIRKNKIPDLNEICWLRDLPKLKFLWLEENPAAMVHPGNYFNLLVAKSCSFKNGPFPACFFFFQYK